MKVDAVLVLTEEQHKRLQVLSGWTEAGLAGLSEGIARDARDLAQELLAESLGRGRVPQTGERDRWHRLRRSG